MSPCSTKAMTLFTLTSTQRCAQPELADLADGARSQVRTQLPQRSDLLYQTMEPCEMIGNYDRVSAVGAMTLAAKRWVLITGALRDGLLVDVLARNPFLASSNDSLWLSKDRQQQ